MGFYEKDPRNIGYIALFVAITWYKAIPSDAALRIAQGKSSAKPGVKLTPEMRERIYKIIYGSTFKNFNTIEKKFKVNRYDIVAREEELFMSKASMLVQAVMEKFNALRKISEDCTASDCEGCLLNNMFSDEKTICDFLLDIDVDEQGRPVYVKNTNVHKCPQMSTIGIFQGSTSARRFRIYDNVMNEVNKYIAKHKEKKIQDIISAALLEYIEKHK